ncbi:hypothetical protein ZEAMMB73_Zm00001d029694 [Zea mays]|uniref:Uncharacterized protein n=1 Tax=Zea mays TaxID=4577 RepID=A0A1D6K733_MAIZE|nr:hypothetical protein ZEAMMB73_Zm00001d029694 [Zea mays]
MAREIHGRQICAYLFLSSPQREIQVKREELLEYAQSIISGLKRNNEIVSFTKESSDSTRGINGERSEIAEIEAASTGEAARLRAALRRAPPDAIRQHHQIYTGLHRPVLIRAEQRFFHFGPRPS